ncbi:MAG: hypothetical protein LBB64_05135 [Dysgonamonadaceae bacterium]|jgi:hypothetical protein|nr:hypothetical protein [Dysgonamonadaceae bacterium]
MQAYKFDTRVTKDGTISLPFVPMLFDKEVEIIILTKTEIRETKHKITPSEFVRKWSGVIKEIPENDTNDLRYEYLKKKYGLTSEPASDKEMDEARFNYLNEKYK